MEIKYHQECLKEVYLRDKIRAGSTPKHGGRSSMAEHLTVDQVVVGSTPIAHPNMLGLFPKNLLNAGIKRAFRHKGSFYYSNLPATRKSLNMDYPMNLQDLTTMYDFTGKTFAVTGGAGALGSDVVVALAGCGANVMILDLRLGGVDAIKERLGERASLVEVIEVNVMNRDSLVTAGEAIIKRFGQLYGLVNAAGGNSPRATVSSTMSYFDIPEEALRFVLDLNILGTMIPCQVLAKLMTETGEGVILNYSSMNAYRPLTNIAAYSASKAAITNFTSWLAVYLAQNYSCNIRVNAIAPGFFLGEQNRFLMIDKDTGGWTPRGQKIIDHTPMGRLGNPEDLLGCVLWLLSPAASFVTGITVPVDGGFSAYAGV